jgi:hypothetical protein
MKFRGDRGKVPMLDTTITAYRMMTVTGCTLKTFQSIFTGFTASNLILNISAVTIFFLLKGWNLTIRQLRAHEAI